MKGCWQIGVRKVFQNCFPDQREMLVMVEERDFVAKGRAHHLDVRQRDVCAVLIANSGDFSRHLPSLPVEIKKLGQIKESLEVLFVSPSF